MPSKIRTSSMQTPKNGKTLGRRGFLATALGGLSIAFTMPDVGRVFGIQAATPPTSQQLANAYINIGTDGTITLMFGGSEMGQGIKTGLAQILAEELMVDWNQVTVRQSLVDPIVTYLTGGSNAVSGRYNNLRAAGAATRKAPAHSPRSRRRTRPTRQLPSGSPRFVERFRRSTRTSSMATITRARGSSSARRRLGFPGSSPTPALRTPRSPVV